MIAAATSAVAHPLALPTVPAQVRGCAGSVPHSTSYSIGYVKGRRLQAAFRPTAALLRGLPYAWRTAFVVPRRFTPTTYARHPLSHDRQKPSHAGADTLGPGSGAQIPHTDHPWGCDRRRPGQNRAARSHRSHGLHHCRSQNPGYVVPPGLVASGRNEPVFETGGGRLHQGWSAWRRGGRQGGGSLMTDEGRKLIALYRHIEATARTACRSDIRRLMEMLAR